MRDIDKRQEPASLVEYRAKPCATYDDLKPPVKQDIRDNLLREQGHICCYCMSRINSDSMTIEHWHSQHEYPTEQLDYRNMLAVCPGNKGNPPKAQHCDTRKKKHDLIFNPADSQHDVESRLKYLGDGTIQSSDTVFNTQLNNVLNLNFSRLKDNREAVVRAVEQAVNTRPGTRTRSQIENQISKWDSLDGDGKRKPFSAVAIYFLRKWLGRARR